MNINEKLAGALVYGKEKSREVPIVEAKRVEDPKTGRNTITLQLNTLKPGMYETSLGMIGIKEIRAHPADQQPRVVVDTEYTADSTLKDGKEHKTVYINHKTGSGLLNLPKADLVVDLGGPIRPRGVSLRQAVQRTGRNPWVK